MDHTENLSAATLYNLHNQEGDSQEGVPKPPFDVSSFDYYQYVSVDAIESVKEPWIEDEAFIPTVVTYSVAFTIGVAGNALVVFALLGDKKSRNVTSSFLVSLAMADLLFLLVCIPYDTAAKMTLEWFGGLGICKFYGFVEMLSAVASIMNLTAVSVERYVVIVHPMKSRSWCTMGSTQKIIVGVWFLSLGLSSPMLYIMDTTVGLYYNNETYVKTELCLDANYETKGERLVFAWYQLLTMFLVPSIVMVYCYAVVIRVLWLSTKELAKMTHTKESYHDGEEESRQRLTSGSRRGRGIIRQAVKEHSSEVRDARKQVIKMLLTIICVFLLCWGPKLVLNILKRHELAILHNKTAFFIVLAMNLLPYIQSASNPLIYCFMSKNFRWSLRTACRSCCHCDPATVMHRKRPHMEFDMDTKSVTINGTYTSRMSPGATRNARTSVTAVAEF